MRISDWSSDVCSSDLLRTPERGDVVVPKRFEVAIFQLAAATLTLGAYPQLVLVVAVPALGLPALAIRIATMDRFPLIDHQHADRHAAVHVQPLYGAARAAVGINSDPGIPWRAPPLHRSPLPVLVGK